MSTFSERQLEDKLASLSSSQQSIQTLSLWIIHHRRAARNIVEVWHKIFLKSDEKKKLVLFYLANDVLQTSRKQGSEFIKEFTVVLPNVMTVIQSKYPDSNLAKSTLRVLAIWEDREVFPVPYVISLKSTLGVTGEDSHPTNKDQPSIPMSPIHANKDCKPITTTELVEAIGKFDRSVAADSTLQARVAALPQEMIDTKLLTTLKDKQAVEDRMKQLSDALKLVASRDGRLVAEIEDRRELIVQLEGCIACQNQKIKEAMEAQKACRNKLECIREVKRELSLQRDNFPDLLIRKRDNEELANEVPAVRPVKRL
eukprot:Ihof_evm1s5 gene=Ihof_evmTU1s5